MLVSAEVRKTAEAAWHAATVCFSLLKQARVLQGQVRLYCTRPLLPVSQVAPCLPPQIEPRAPVRVWETVMGPLTAEYDCRATVACQLAAEVPQPRHAVERLAAPQGERCCQPACTQSQSPGLQRSPWRT